MSRFHLSGWPKTVSCKTLSLSNNLGWNIGIIWARLLSFEPGFREQRHETSSGIQKCSPWSGEERVSGDLCAQVCASTTKRKWNTEQAVDSALTVVHFYMGVCVWVAHGQGGRRGQPPPSAVRHLRSSLSPSSSFCSVLIYRHRLFNKHGRHVATSQIEAKNIRVHTFLPWCKCKRS